MLGLFGVALSKRRSEKKVAIVADISQASLLNPTKYYYFLSLDSKGAKVGIPRRKKPEKTPRKSRRKNCANVGSADRKREKLLQRNIIPAQFPIRTASMVTTLQ